MTDEVETLKARRKAMMREIVGTFKRSSDPHPKQRRASLTWQVNLIDKKIRQVRGQTKKANCDGQG